MFQQATGQHERLRSLKRVGDKAIQRIGNSFAPVGVKIAACGRGQCAGGEKFRLKAGEELAHDVEATRQDGMEMITLGYAVAGMWRLGDIVPIEKDHLIEEIGGQSRRH